MPAHIDNGRHEYYERENLEFFHICENCEEEFETTRPVPPEETRCCGECFLWATDVIQQWWKRKFHYMKTHCYDCNVEVNGNCLYRNKMPLCYRCHAYHYDY